jgi:hypothetical protein
LFSWFIPNNIKNIMARQLEIPLLGHDISSILCQPGTILVTETETRGAPDRNR